MPSYDNENSKNKGRDFSQFKDMFRHEGIYEESTHPDDFLGGSQHADLSHSPKRSDHRSSASRSPYNKNKQHRKWGAPQEPEQFRPDDWLTPAKSPVRSWHPKSAPVTEGTGHVLVSTGGVIPSIPLMMDDNDTTIQTSTLSSGNSSHHERRMAVKESGKKHVPRRWMGQRSTHSRGDADHDVLNSGSSHSVGSFASESMASTTATATTNSTPGKVIRKKYKIGVMPTKDAPVQPRRLPSLDAKSVTSVHGTDMTLMDNDDDNAAVDMTSSNNNHTNVAPKDETTSFSYSQDPTTPIKSPRHQFQVRTSPKKTTYTATPPKRTVSTPVYACTSSLSGVVSAPTTPSHSNDAVTVPSRGLSLSQRRAQEDEKISTQKFTAAFAAFENNDSRQSPRRMQSLQPVSLSSTGNGGDSGAYVPRTQEQKQRAREKRADHRQRQKGQYGTDSNFPAKRSTTMDIASPGSSRSSGTPTTPTMGPPRRIQSLISPRYNVRRNFTVSKEARLREQSLLTLDPEDSSSSSSLNLQDIIAQLRKVHHDNKGDHVDAKCSTDTFLQDMIRRLRHVEQNLPADEQNPELSKMIRALENADELGVEELQSMLDSLQNSMQQDTKSSHKTKKKEDPNISRLAKEDHDWLESALRRLKKVALTPREANAVADTVVKMKYVELSDSVAEAESHALIVKLCDTALVYPSRKAHQVILVLQGLRRIDFNDQERKVFANRIRGVSVDQPHVDELAEAILRLKKACLNHWEARQVAGIMVNLRKTMKNLRADIDEDDEEHDDHDDDEEHSRVTRSELRQLVDSNKMDAIDEVVELFKKTQVLVKASDQEMDDFCTAVVNTGKGDASMKQKEHQDYVDILAEAIRNLKKAKLNKWEANEVSGILTSLRKTPKQNHRDNNDNRHMINLRKVTSAEKMDIIEDVFKKVKKVVRFNLNEEVFEFFLDDVVATGTGEPTREQLAQIGAIEGGSDNDISYADLKSDGGTNDDDAEEVASVDTRTISISSAEITLGEEEVELTDSEGEDDDKEGVEEEPSTTLPKSRRDPSATATDPFPKRHNQLAHRSCPSSPASEDPLRKIVFARKHHWKHKQHNTTVVSEKRWRLCEDFATDEVIFSPLSKDQHNRRKAVEGSLKKSLWALGGSSRSLGDHNNNIASNSQNGITTSTVSTTIDLNHANDEEEETHVDTVERRLRENNIDLNKLLIHANSSKKAVCITPSPKRSMNGRRLVMTDQPDLPF
jgi:hypothetical protein